MLTLTQWRLISNRLPLNCLSLVESAEDKGAAALREMLLLEVDLGGAALRGRSRA